MQEEYSDDPLQILKKMTVKRGKLIAAQNPNITLTSISKSIYQFMFLKDSAVTLLPPDNYKERKKKRHSTLFIGHLCIY